MEYVTQSIILKPGKEKAILNHHHWIFSGAIASHPCCADGDIVSVYDSKNSLLGHAFYNKKSSIMGRMISWGDLDPKSIIANQIQEAISFRQGWFANKSTTGFRLINGEGDRLPGLVVDQYADVLVVQISTLGMQKLKPFILSELKKLVSPRSIYEKSLSPSRKEEGLEPSQGLWDGEDVDEVEILENGLKFRLSIKHGQKTGFFLDQREMRSQIKDLSLRKNVLNCFSYSGGFSVYADAGGALAVDSVDISEKAMLEARANVELNSQNTCQHQFFCEDVFEFLRHSSMNYDLVILDPPAFAKKKRDQIPACRAYKDINRLAMKKMPKNSFLLTCSCSYYVEESLFQKVIFQACEEANRKAQIIGRHRMAVDHPINLSHPEGDYLKSFLLYLS